MITVASWSSLWFGSPLPKPAESYYPGRVETKLSLSDRWGTCFTSHDGGFSSEMIFQRKLNPQKGLFLEIYETDRQTAAKKWASSTLKWALFEKADYCGTSILRRDKDVAKSVLYNEVSLYRDSFPYPGYFTSAKSKDWIITLHLGQKCSYSRTKIAFISRSQNTT